MPGHARAAIGRRYDGGQATAKMAIRIAVAGEKHFNGKF